MKNLLLERKVIVKNFLFCATCKIYKRLNECFLHLKNLEVEDNFSFLIRLNQYILEKNKIKFLKKKLP